ncbi:MAG: efflux transporter outer membrane subunit [Alphaproteobacteria bacterium]|nr:efflux transporter outer membrane subunit [Alphaproteobacteria bacterium]
MRFAGYFTTVLPFTALVLAGCATVPAREAGMGIDQNAAYSSAAPNAKTTDDQEAILTREGWWHLYQDSSLDALMNAAFIDNPGLNQTQARLAQAEATARGSASSLFPQLSVSGARGTSRGDNSSPSDFDLRGAASYELDLWGQNRASAESSSLLADASREDLRAAAVSLSATITEDWLKLLAAREEEDLLKKQIDVNATILALQNKRFAMGNASALDILQQKQALAKAKAQMPDILATQEQLEHQLAILIGRLPSDGLDIKGSSLPPALPLPKTGLPSDLLGARPDIAAGWMRLRSADWAAASATAARLPSFSLSATYSTSAAVLDGLFQTWLLDLAANLALPVIDGGALRAEEARQKAIADENFHAYREIVLNAVGDVEDALSLNAHQDDELVALNAELEAAQSTLKQAQISYTNGDQDYINVLDALTSLQSLEQQIVQERLNLHLDRVALYRALGGRSWADHALDAARNKDGEQ